MKCFEKDRDLLQCYHEIDQLRKGVIEKAEEKNGNRKHYIPHHAINTLEESTSKVRIVTTRLQKQERIQRVLMNAYIEVQPFRKISVVCC